MSNTNIITDPAAFAAFCKKTGISSQTLKQIIINSHDRRQRDRSQLSKDGEHVETKKEDC